MEKAAGTVVGKAKVAEAKVVAMAQAWVLAQNNPVYIVWQL